jgi:hypothetical protein
MVAVLTVPESIMDFGLFKAYLRRRRGGLVRSACGNNASSVQVADDSIKAALCKSSWSSEGFRVCSVGTQHVSDSRTSQLFAEESSSSSSSSAAVKTESLLSMVAPPGRCRAVVCTRDSISDFGATRRFFPLAQSLESEDDDSQLLGGIDAWSVSGRRRFRRRFRRWDGGEWSKGGTIKPASPSLGMVEGADAARNAVGALAATTAAGTFHGTWCPGKSAARMATVLEERQPFTLYPTCIVKNSGQKMKKTSTWRQYCCTSTFNSTVEITYSGFDRHIS